MPKLRSLVPILLCVVLLLALCASVATGAPVAKAATEQAKVKSLDKANAEETDFLASLNADDEKQNDQKEDAPLYVTALRFILSLALVLGLVYVTILGLKKFTGMRGLGALGVGQHRIKVLENSSLGANRSLHLVEVGSKKLLIASTPNQISLITEFAADEISDTNSGQSGGGFKDQLSTFMGNKPDTTQTAKSVAEMLRESSSFLQDKVREVGSFRRNFTNVESR